MRSPEFIPCAVYAPSATIAAAPERASGLAALHALTRGTAAVRVAVLDGPVDLTHPALRGARLHVLTSLQAASLGGESLRHGTQVASILFGQPGSPVDGVAPDCTGLIIPIFEDTAEGIAPCSQARLAEAIQVALEHGAHVINISAGELLQGDDVDPALVDAIRACAERNVLVVAAVGNDGCECLHVPAALAPVLAVGSAGADGRPLDSSNWGTPYRTRGLIAPAEEVRCAEPGGGFALMSGTSAATPLVAGVAALLVSLQIRVGATPDPSRVGADLLDGAIPCDPRFFTQCDRHLAGTLHFTPVVRSILEGNPGMSCIAHDPSPPSADLHGRQPAIGEPPPPSSAVEAGLVPGTPCPPLPDVDVSRAALLRAAPGRAAIRPQGVSPSACGCNGGAPAAPAALEIERVYALGTLGYDFGTEAHRDAFEQSMPPEANSPHAPEHVLAHLRNHPYEAQSLIWTLNIDATPVYAIAPSGAYAAAVFDRLRSFYEAQIAGSARIVSVPGHLAGYVRLHSGQSVPLLVPVLRGMYCWSTDNAVEQAVGERPEDPVRQADYDKRSQWLRNFLSRVYFDLRNLGLTPEDRALNFSATNAFQAAQVMREVAMDEQSELNTISVRKSPICRPGSDCYDVQLRFFNPQNTHMADRVFRFTVDVSGLVPVSIGQLRSWYER
jgi:cyanobactin maturation PatA/PatG family protease